MDLNGIKEDFSYSAAMKICLKDDLIKKITIGSSYRFTGIIVNAISTFNKKLLLEPMFEAVQVCNKTVSVPPRTLCDPYSNIWKLQKEYNNSPWRLSAKLSLDFGVDVAPSGSYFLLKLGILLSIVASRSDHRWSKNISYSKTKLHILTVGENSLAIERLFKLGSLLGERAVYKTTNTELIADFSTTWHNHHNHWVYGAGALALADSGICLMYDLNFQRKEDKEALWKVMEDSSITVEIPRKYKGECLTDKQTHILYPLACTVWSSSANRLIGISESLVRQFNLVIPVNDSICEGSKSVRIDLANNVVTSNNSCEQFRLKPIDYNTLINLASEFEVQFPNDARALVEQYILARRQSLFDCQLNITFPLNAINTVWVCKEDVILAIWLNEETILSMYGQSDLMLSSNCYTTTNTIVDTQEIWLQQFSVHLSTFLANFNS
ncbi:MCM domain-containing protein 2 [Trichoplax sp. H2]|nr:MCM domain-containing protein 2 [Trichoplax sp. H2]|eukprot:RDD45926.1 MCM domain-containing protein 2 [Trichoplax sp. H2]